MKKTLLACAALSLSLAACNSHSSYTINGTVEGEQTGNAYLVKPNGQQIDTLAKASIANGKFSITGKADSLIQAFVTIEGQRGGTPIFLENTEYTATLSTTDPMSNKIEGTETQNLLNQYTAIEIEAHKAQSALYKEYSEAAQTKDTAKMNEIEARFDQLGKHYQEKADSITKANSNTYLAAYMVASNMGGMDAEELAAKYEILGPDAKATTYGKKIAERIQKLSAVAVGQVAPDFTLNTPEGQPLSMHSIKGKVKIIDFWASWCGPCRGENPNVVKIYKEFHPKGLEILGVSLDSNKEAWMKAIEDDQLTWNHVSDLKGWGSEAAQLYAVNGIPHMIVLDENNVIVAKNLRGDALKAKIAEMLK